MQRDANETIQGAVREVNTAYAGQPSATVDAVLRQRFADLGIEPSEPGFTTTVTAIANGEMRN